MMQRVAILVLLSLALGACKPKPEPALDQATVVAEHASVRLKNSSTSRTLVTLDTGDKVDVLEQADNWYRIRYGTLTGWMEESTLVTNYTKARILSLVMESEKQKPQNTASIRESANFRIEPGRSTAIIRKLDGGARVEVLDRVTTPRPGSDGAQDAWIKVRSSPTEVGWVYANLVDFDVPVEISQYTEGYQYTAVKSLNQVEDTIVGPIHWYIVGERSPGLDAHLDFDGVRVFTWNTRKHRYETAFRTRGLRGIYPLEVSSLDGNPAFRVHELTKEGSKVMREFMMNGVIVREVKKKLT